MRDVGKLTNVHHVVFILQHCRYNDDIALLPHSTTTFYCYCYCYYCYYYYYHHHHHHYMYYW